MKVNGDRPRLGGGAGIERIYFLICNEVDSQNDDQSRLASGATR